MKKVIIENNSVIIQEMSVSEFIVDTLLATATVAKKRGFTKDILDKVFEEAWNKAQPSNIKRTESFLTDDFK